MTEVSTKYPLGAGTWDVEEVRAIDQLLQSGSLAMGERVSEFEKRAAQYFGSRYAVLVNSGSSANLLAIGALRYTQKQPLLPGDEVILPAIVGPTTCYPLHQYGLKLRFVDVDPLTFNIDPHQILGAITRHTKAVFAVNVLGTSCDYSAILDICNRYGLILIEDNCESIGAKWEKKFCGTFGRLGTFSLQQSHQISTVEGGFVLTNEKELYHLLLSLRSYGGTKQLPHYNQLEEKAGSPFHDSYRFVVPGYNTRPINLTGAVGIPQLKKLPHFIEGRRRNGDYFEKVMQDIEGIRIQQQHEGSAWYGFAIVLENPHQSKRDEVVDYLQRSGIECKPILVGNFVKNPVTRYFDYSVYGNLPAANEIDTRGFVIGNRHLDLRKEITYFEKCLKSILFPKKSG